MCLESSYICTIMIIFAINSMVTIVSTIPMIGVRMYVPCILLIVGSIIARATMAHALGSSIGLKSIAYNSIATCMSIDNAKYVLLVRFRIMVFTCITHAV